MANEILYLENYHSADNYADGFTNIFYCWPTQDNLE